MPKLSFINSVKSFIANGWDKTLLDSNHGKRHTHAQLQNDEVFSSTQPATTQLEIMNIIQTHGQWSHTLSKYKVPSLPNLPMPLY